MVEGGGFVGPEDGGAAVVVGEGGTVVLTVVVGPDPAHWTRCGQLHSRIVGSKSKPGGQDSCQARPFVQTKYIEQSRGSGWIESSKEGHYWGNIFM